MTQNCSAFWGWASWKVARQVLSFIRTSWALVDQLPNWSVLCSTKWPVSLFEIYWNLLSDSNGMLKWETDGEDVFYELTPETKQITSHVFKSVLKASKFDYPLECMLVHIWMVVDLPLWKKKSSVGIIIPNTWKNKIHVPNHQPNIPKYVETTEDLIHSHPVYDWTLQVAMTCGNSKIVGIYILPSGND